MHSPLYWKVKNVHVERQRPLILNKNFVKAFRSSLELVGHLFVTFEFVTLGGHDEYD